MDNFHHFRDTTLLGATFLLTACAPSTAIKQLEAPAVNVVSKNAQAPQARRLVNVPLEAKSDGKSVAADCRLDTPY